MGERDGRRRRLNTEGCGKGCKAWVGGKSGSLTQWVWSNDVAGEDIEPRGGRNNYWWEAKKKGRRRVKKNNWESLNKFKGKAEKSTKKILSRLGKGGGKKTKKGRESTGSGRRRVGRCSLQKN